MDKSIFIRADELAAELDVSKALAYKMINQWNEELKAKGYSYLAEFDRQVRDTLILTEEQMRQTEGITEELKRQDQLEWVCRMNNIRSRAEEIITAELVNE